MTELAPPYSSWTDAPAALRERGWVVLAPDPVRALIDDGGMARLAGDWASLPLDEHLRDGGRYRKRRHACFTFSHGELELVAPRAHWQPVEYNALHGGMERWFAPIEDASLASPVWAQLLGKLADLASALHPSVSRWFLEAHELRIDTTDGIGRPTPEGAHRDGVDLVAVLFIDRRDVKGGETRLFEADGPNGTRFTMTEPFTLLLLDDARVIHESTPIQPREPGSTVLGHRDTLVVTLRRGGFQSA